MARTLAQLPKGTRITDPISLGVIAKAFPANVIEEILRRTRRTSRRRRRRRRRPFTMNARRSRPPSTR